MYYIVCNNKCERLRERKEEKDADHDKDTIECYFEVVIVSFRHELVVEIQEVDVHYCRLTKVDWDYHQLVKQVDEHWNQKHYEVRMITYSYTIIDPWTMVVIHWYTFVTVLTMFTS